jgi:hypothetical protein
MLGRRFNVGASDEEKAGANYCSPWEDGQRPVRTEGGIAPSPPVQVTIDRRRAPAQITPGSSSFVSWRSALTLDRLNSRHGSESRAVERVGLATRRPDCALSLRCSGDG